MYKIILFNILIITLMILEAILITLQMDTLFWTKIILCTVIIIMIIIFIYQINKMYITKTKSIEQIKYVKDKNMEVFNKYLVHEIKNSLSVLKGNVYLDNNKLSENIDLIDKQIDDIYALTINEIIKSKVDLLNICSNVIEDYDAKIGLSFEEQDYNIYGNEILLQRVFVNIINNAFKHGASKLDIKFISKENNIIIKLENNSPQIPFDKINKIFQMNYKVDKLNKDGSGIGLSLVKNVMRLHDSSVFVESFTDKTIFYLSFEKYLKENGE